MRNKENPPLYLFFTKPGKILKISFFVFVALLTVSLYSKGAFDKMELAAFDYRFMLKGLEPGPSDIVMIDMDDSAVSSIGRWPWPRKWHAALIAALHEYKPKAIVFDVIFSEPQDKSDDEALSQAMGIAKNVYLPIAFEIEPRLPEDVSEGRGILTSVNPIAILLEKTRGIGHINAFPDKDGILRRIPPIINYKGKNVLGLGLKVGCDAIGAEERTIVFDPQRHRIRLFKGDGSFVEVPLDRNNNLLINWQGPWGKDFAHYSYLDIIKSYSLTKKGERPIVDLGVFRDKICVIGLTALGLIDIKPTPIDNTYPACGVNALIAASVIKGEFVRETPAWFDTLWLIFISFAGVFFFLRLSPPKGMIFAFAFEVLSLFFSIALFNFFNLAILVTYPAFAIFLSYLAAAFYLGIRDAIERGRLFKEASRDGLTGLYNRGYFVLSLGIRIKKAVADKGLKFCLIMLDIDNFKSVNDRFGHLAGDAVLREAALTIQSNCRGSDIVARYGGEEFAIILSGAGSKEAADTAEKIRDFIEKVIFKKDGQEYGITVSLGVAEFSNERSPEELIKKSDEALYKAKGLGKNKICVFGSK